MLAFLSLYTGCRPSRFCRDVPFYGPSVASAVVILARTPIFSERRPSVRLSVVSPSVTLVNPTQPVEIFGNMSMPFGTLAIS